MERLVILRAEQHVAVYRNEIHGMGDATQIRRAPAFRKQINDDLWVAGVFLSQLVDVTRCTSWRKETPAVRKAMQPDLGHAVNSPQFHELVRLACTLARNNETDMKLQRRPPHCAARGYAATHGDNGFEIPQLHHGRMRLRLYGVQADVQLREPCSNQRVHCLKREIPPVGR